MFAEVKQFQWTDVEDDTVVPVPHLLEMFVTTPGQAGLTRHEVAVTTMEELSQRMKSQPYIAGHGQVVVARFDRRGIESFSDHRLLRSARSHGRTLMQHSVDSAGSR